MNLTLSVNDEVVAKARKRAEQLGTSLNQLVREYLEQLAGTTAHVRDAEEFDQLSEMTHGDPQGWKFDREEAHERR